MIERIKEIFRKIDDIYNYFIEEKLDKSYPSIDLCREILHQVTLKDFTHPEEELDEASYKEYCGRASIAFKGLIEPELTRIIAAQLEFTGRFATDWEQVLVSRGTINGAYLVLERFKELHDKHLENIRPPEPFNREKTLAELTSERST